MALSVLLPTASAQYVMAWNDGMPLGGVRGQAVVLQAENGTVYVIGGVTDILAYDAVDLVDSYDPATGAWNTLAPLLEPVRGASGGIGSDGRIYIFAGWSDPLVDYGGTQIYNPANNTWISGAVMPTQVWEAKCANTGTHMYVMGGESNFVNYEQQVQIYNVTTDSWWSGTDMPVGVTSGAVVTIGADAYYFGGENWTDITDEVLKYNIPGDSWARVTRMPDAVCAEAAIVGPDGLIYVFGGADGASNIPTTTFAFGSFYDVAADAWGLINDLMTPRAWLGAAVYGDNVLAIGGNDDVAVFSSVESLDISWSTASLQQQIGMLQQQIDQANNDITGLTGNVSDLNAKNVQLKQQLVNLSAQLNQTTDDLNAALEAANNNANNAKSAADSANMIGMIGIIIGIVAILIAVIALVMKKKASIQQMPPMPPE